MVLGRYSAGYASMQFRSLQQFFKWLSAEDDIADPMAGLRPPAVPVTPVPFFTTVELSRLEATCRGSSFAQRRDAAIIAVFRAAGIRLSEMAGIRCDPDDPDRSDLDLQAREIKIRGKGGKERTVRIGHQAARAVDRYLRARARHPQAWRPQLWLGVNGRGPLAADGIYQMTARHGREAGVNVHPHRFRHHFSHTWLDRDGEGGDLMELNGWSSPQMLDRYARGARAARARRTYDRIMEDNP
jgi:integrase/recombinase XerD